ncbi:MAG: phosphopantetheine-binding protein [Chloroflexota bacterium]
MTTAMAMNKTEIRGMLLEALAMIAPEANFATLAPDVNVREALDIDSFDFLNFLIEVDRMLGVETPEADYGKLNSLDEMVAYFGARVNT